MYSYKITLFTPTYNRGYIIGRLYESIKRQRFTGFEWLVVDDGSSDNTRELFDAWCLEENPFPIRYVRQENGGKCRAINHGLKIAQGELFFNIDSDDYLADDALEKVAAWAEQIPADGLFCGFTGNLGTSAEQTTNTLFEGGYLDGTSLDRYSTVDGERAFIFYTDIHRRYLYPEYPGEKFVTEAVAWDQMAHDGYKLRYHNDIITIYAYRDDGLTSKGYELFLKNPRGTGIWFRQKAEYLCYTPMQKLGLWYGYVCDTMELMTDREIAEAIGMPAALVAPMKGVHRFSHFIRGKR